MCRRSVYNRYAIGLEWGCKFVTQPVHSIGVVQALLFRVQEAQVGLFIRWVCCGLNGCCFFRNLLVVGCSLGILHGTLSYPSFYLVQVVHASERSHLCVRANAGDLSHL